MVSRQLIAVGIPTQSSNFPPSRFNLFFPFAACIRYLTRSPESTTILNQVVNYSPAQLDTAFSALADPVRREIIAHLLRGPATVTQVAEPFDISLPAISRHVRVLESAGLLVRRKQGRYHHLHLNVTPLRRAAGWLVKYTEFWEGQFDALEKFLAVDGEEDQE